MSDGKQIDGIKHDRTRLDAAISAASGRGDGRISAADALLALVADGGAFTAAAQGTVAYMRENFTWTDKADRWFRRALKDWGRATSRLSLCGPRAPCRARWCSSFGSTAARTWTSVAPTRLQGVRSTPRTSLSGCGASQRPTRSRICGLRVCALHRRPRLPVRQHAGSRREALRSSVQRHGHHGLRQGERSSPHRCPQAAGRSHPRSARSSLSAPVCCTLPARLRSAGGGGMVMQSVVAPGLDAVPGRILPSPSTPGGRSISPDGKKTHAPPDPTLSLHS